MFGCFRIGGVGLRLDSGCMKSGGCGLYRGSVASWGVYECGCLAGFAGGHVASGSAL